MDSSYLNKHPWRTLGWFLAGLICLLIFMEGWRYSVKPDIVHKETIITKSLNEAKNIFQNRQRELLEKTKSLANELQQEDLQDSTIGIYNILESYSNLWGAVLTKNGEPIVWNGFSLGILQEAEWQENPGSYIEIKKQNNVLYWLCHVGFTAKSQNEIQNYHLYTSERIIQMNALKVGNEQEYHIFSNADRRYNYPVAVNIFKPAPDQNVSYRILTNAEEDSAGIVYAVPGHFQQVLQQWKETNNLWRSVFAIFCFTALLFFITFFIDLKSVWQNLFIRIFLISLGWLFFNYISISTIWLPGLLEGMPAEMVASYQQLFAFSINGIFLFFIAYAIHHTFQNAPPTYGKAGHTASALIGFVAGAAGMAVIFVAFTQIYSLITGASFSLLTLQIIPPLGVILLYLTIGIMLWGVVMLLLNINRFIFHFCHKHYAWSLPASLVGFIISFGLFKLAGQPFLFSWQVAISLLFYGLISFLSFIYFKYPLIVQRSSTLRNVVAATFILALAGAPIIYFGQLSNRDEMLANTARIYSKQEDEDAKNLTKNLLEQLQNEFQSFTQNDLETRDPFVESRFTETIQSIAKDPLYTFHFQLITSGGNRLAEYSNALKTPEWVHYFNPAQFYATTLMQGINQNYIRPIIQQPTLINQQDYKAFYRGWIPLYGQLQNGPIAWIVGSVYQKRPDLKKPMQAVLASYNYKDWNKPVIIQQYKKGRLSATTYKGARGYFPMYHSLPEAATVRQSDSLFYYNSSNAKYSYRNLIINKSPKNVLKISAISPDIHNILFAFFRFHFTLILAGFVVSLIIQFARDGEIVLVNQNVRFQYRILDSFLLATLIFLILMVAGTYFTLNWQNKNLAKQQLYQELEGIELRSAGITALQPENESGVVLQPLIEQINTDASFYINKRLAKSSTPQIYRQHLLPAVLPFPIYYQLFESGKKRSVEYVTLDGQPLFMGYQLLLNEENEPLAAIAIPTFVQSPEYRGRLLETSSFLVLLYVLIFGVFIIGAIFISRQLTKPLYEIRRGLHRISKGDLDTTIPVKSKDEIGILSISYNRMTKRLKKLQAELAKSEREAAWKEIAQEAAHEIKNPLTPMKLNIQHLKQQAASNNATVEELQKKIIDVTKNMLVQIDSLNTIAYNFLSYASPKKGDFEAVDMHKLIEQIIDLHKNIDHKKLDADLTEKPPIVDGVEDELYSAIFNIVKNAYEASPEGGVIKVKTHVENSNFVMEVNNGGEPIPKDIREDIFAPNFSTKKEGTGLGLAICKKVVNIHEGSIAFKSNKKSGTTFTVKLPLNSNST